MIHMHVTSWHMRGKCSVCCLEILTTYQINNEYKLFGKLYLILSVCQSARTEPEVETGKVQNTFFENRRVGKIQPYKIIRG